MGFFHWLVTRFDDLCPWKYGLWALAQSKRIGIQIVESISPNTSLPTQSLPDSAIENRRQPTFADLRNDGNEAAALDTQAALAKIDTLSGRAQLEFAAGVFAFIAAHSDPEDALTIATSQSDGVKNHVLKTLVAEWTQDPALNEQANTNRQRRIQGIGNGRFGLETELASVIAQSKAPPSVARAWMGAFSDNPGRSEIVARLAPGQPGFDPAASLAEAANWTDWEKSRLEKSLISNWAQ